MDELTLDKVYRRGDRGKGVKMIQEWLSLHGQNVKIDSDFGPATEAAVKDFQRGNGIEVNREVGPTTFGKLVAPMKAALAPIDAAGRSLGELTVAYARQHLAQHPREVGGQNRGPWVRLYMKGNEGEPWAWCAGFACYCLKQAATTAGKPMPIEASFSCDSLAASAKSKNHFLREPFAADRSRIGPGSLFLNRRSTNDWTHTGIVVHAEADVFRTIEGNTNDDGSREGYEVCARTRGYGSKDFVLI
jgi:hypothetical protein